MFRCAQLSTKWVCHTVALLSQEITGEYIIPLTDDIDVMDILGKKYDPVTARFFGLVASVVPAVVAVGAPATVTVSWRDLLGNLVPETDPVTAFCNGVAVPMVMTAGEGQCDVTADAPASYLIEINAACGVEVVVEVTVV